MSKKERLLLIVVNFIIYPLMLPGACWAFSFLAPMPWNFVVTTTLLMLACQIIIYIKAPQTMVLGGIWQSGLTVMTLGKCLEDASFYNYLFWSYLVIYVFRTVVLTFPFIREEA